MISSSDIVTALREGGVEAGDTLFVHSDLRSSLRVAGPTIPAKLQTISDALHAAAAGGAVVVPTFTYSFTEGQEFDVEGTPSTVGAFTEWFRRRPGVLRTPEPIFSVAVEGELPATWVDALSEVGDVECFGPRSIFAYLDAVGAKLVCYGVDIQALTFVHYVERVLGVRYRFPKDFHGTVRWGGRTHTVSARYHVRELEPATEVYLQPLADALQAHGRGKTVQLAQGPSIFVTDTAAVFDVVAQEIKTAPDFLIRRGHETCR